MGRGYVVLSLSFGLSGTLLAGCAAGTPGNDSVSGLGSGSAGSLGVCAPKPSSFTPLSLAGTTCTTTGYGGRGRTLIVDILCPNTGNIDDETLVDTGDLPSAGGSRSAQATTLSVPDVATASSAVAHTGGVGGITQTYAQVSAFTATVDGIEIDATAIGSDAQASCGTASGSTSITNLQVNGSCVTVSGAPNQTLTVGGVSIVINEQTTASGQFVVNALHVTGPSGSVIVSSSAASVTCSCTTGSDGGTGGEGTDAGGGQADATGGSGGDSGGGPGEGGVDVEVGGLIGVNGDAGPSAYGGLGSASPGSSPSGGSGGQIGDSCDDLHTCGVGYVCRPPDSLR
jgi:hypothetical protein